ncbi:rRNA adenine N-6-methyltransferase family protein [Candidatus Hodgkinia cicadicola]
MAVAKLKRSQVFVNASWVSKALSSSVCGEVFLSKVVCEVGAGAGALTTYALKEGVLKLSIIEVDTGFLGTYLCLLKTCPGKLDVILKDGLRVNYSLFVFGSRLDLLIGSLPYNVASKLLMLMRRAGCSMLIIIQKEIYCRLLYNYSGLSLLFMDYKFEKLFDAPSYRFLPKPKVNSVCVLASPVRCSRLGSTSSLVGVLRRFNSL